MKKLTFPTQMIFLFLVALLLSSSIGQTQEVKLQPERSVPPEGFYKPEYRFLFFAVLEGCYNDGLNRADINKIIPLLEDGRRERSKNFVYTCPVCSPAFDGFQLYADRLQLTQQIGKSSNVSSDTFGQGLDLLTREQMAKGGQPCRDAVQGVIEKWIDQRIINLRLTEEETTELRGKLAEMRNDGEAALKRFQSGDNGEWFQKIYQDWNEGCPICSGAAPVMSATQ
ncbi:MAG: hypothetical protein ACI8UO_001504 [Verrucomicrobiales bacterium]|jgi:hypothetical protein